VTGIYQIANVSKQRAMTKSIDNLSRGYKDPNLKIQVQAHKKEMGQLDFCKEKT
tara:strand:+ start:344 stop:505 length:162 start_codon:yes stop_codon:yes gene_type:complete